MTDPTCESCSFWHKLPPPERPEQRANLQLPDRQLANGVLLGGAEELAVLQPVFGQCRRRLAIAPLVSRQEGGPVIHYVPGYAATDSTFPACGDYSERPAAVEREAA